MRQLSPQQDLSSHLLDGHIIHARNHDGETKIAVERLELHLGDPAGVSLSLSRVHALSSVRRRRPIFVLPPRAPLIIDRSAELETLRQSLIARHVVDLHGPDGAGKSTLARALIHECDLNRFPDGVVYFSGHIPHQDLLQALFDGFYESDAPVKITPDQAQTYLGNLRVLVVLDDVGLGPKQIDPVLDALDEAAILVIGPERTALGRGRALRLKGLPRQDAVELFRRACATQPSPDESPLVDAICILLNDMPLSILSVAAQTAQSKRNYTKILTDLQGRKPWAGPGADPAVGPSLEQIVFLLDAADRRLLTALAVFPPQGAPSEALAEILGLSVNEFQERVNRLQALNLIQAIRPAHQKARHGSGDNVAPRLALVSAYYQTVRTWLVDDAAREDVINFYATRLGRGDQLAGEELPCLLTAIEDCAQNGTLDLMEPMVTAADRGLAKLRWWAAWQHVLNLVRRTAQAEGDRALEAWAMHQLGSVSGALRDYERGIPLLRTAVSLRQALGDTIGTALSARNLDVLERLMPAPSVEEVSELEAPAEPLDEPDASAPALQREDIPETAPAPARRTRRLGLGLALFVACVLLLTGALAVRYGRQPSQSQNGVPPLTASWEFGDAWNELDNETWTQEIKIVAADGDDDYRYFVNGEAVGEMFQVVLPLCDGASGIIRVESGDGQSVEVPFEFDSPYCR